MDKSKRQKPRTEALQAPKTSAVEHRAIVIWLRWEMDRAYAQALTWREASKHDQSVVTLGNLRFAEDAYQAFHRALVQAETIGQQRQKAGGFAPPAQCEMTVIERN